MLIRSLSTVLMLMSLVSRVNNFFFFILIESSIWITFFLLLFKIFFTFLLMMMSLSLLGMEETLVVWWNQRTFTADVWFKLAIFVVLLLVKWDEQSFSFCFINYFRVHCRGVKFNLEHVSKSFIFNLKLVNFRFSVVQVFVKCHGRGHKHCF